MTRGGPRHASFEFLEFGYTAGPYGFTIALVARLMFIEYTFNMDDGKVLFFHVDFERPRERNLPIAEYPEWTRLRFHQCINCPLSGEEFSHCPVAIDAHEIVAGFSEVISCRLLG